MLDLKFQVIEIVIKLTLFGNSGIEKKQTPIISKDRAKVKVIAGKDGSNRGASSRPSN